MTVEDLLKALLGFLLGLTAKMVYDLWSEKRKQQHIVLRKIVRSSFSTSQLDEKLRKDVQVLFGCGSFGTGRRSCVFNGIRHFTGGRKGDIGEICFWEAHRSRFLAGTGGRQCLLAWSVGSRRGSQSAGGVHDEKSAALSPGRP